MTNDTVFRVTWTLEFFYFFFSVECVKVLAKLVLFTDAGLR